MSSTAYETDYNQWLKETVKQLREQSLRPPIDWDIIPTQVPKRGSNLKSIFNLIITSYLNPVIKD
jgi:hypothetical protein